MAKHNVLGIIPARLGSTRLKEKMLIDIAGKPMLYWTCKQASKATSLTRLIVATDDKRISEIVKGFDIEIEVIMTSKKIKSGSDRIAIAAQKFTGFRPDIVVNIQGDEPLIPITAIDNCVNALKTEKEAVIVTPATLFPKNQNPENPNFVKVIMDKNGYALYFSRSLLPFPRDHYSKYWKHLGLYAFKTSFLQEYTKLKPTPLEKAEKLEQLRVLENGYKIKIVKGNFNQIEVNTYEELEMVRKLMKK